MTAPEDNLPPVQPPSAGFLMQLFVVPMVIVVVIVMVCLMFNWLAHLGTQPRDLVGDLGKLNAGSWQKALTVANMLTDRRNEALRRDSEMAGQLAAILDEQLEAGQMAAEPIKLRVYLCFALGVFEVDEGRAELIKAAGVQRGPAELEVRKSAIEALARRADQSPEIRQSFQQDQQIMEVLRQAAAQRSTVPAERDLDAQLRLRAAYALGVIGGPEALEILVAMLSDAEPSVRFNAATGLARHGDERCVPRLIEMLQVGDTVSDANTVSDPILNDFDATTVIRNALRATVQLAEGNPSLNLAELTTVVEQLASDQPTNAGVRRVVEIDAKQALQKLNAVRASWTSVRPVGAFVSVFDRSQAFRLQRLGKAVLLAAAKAPNCNN